MYTAADFEVDERHVIKNEKVVLDRFGVRQNVFVVLHEHERLLFLYTDTCLTAISGCLIFCKATVTEIYSTSVTFNNYRTVRWRLQHNTSIFIRVTCGADGRVDCTAGARSTLVGILRAID